MMFRIPLSAAVAVTVVAVAGPLMRAADEKVHEAAVVKAGDGKITLTLKADDKKHTHDVAKDAKITLDDKKAKLEELKEGFSVKVTINDKSGVIKIDARTASDGEYVLIVEGMT